MSDQLLVGPLLARYSPTIDYLWLNTPGFYPKEALLKALFAEEMASFIRDRGKSSLVLDLAEASTVGTEVLEALSDRGQGFWGALGIKQVAVVLPDNIFSMTRGLFPLWEGERDGVVLRFFAAEQFNQGWDVVAWLSPEQ